jgi:glycosyltransferase involved in cell wall biosynthesis
MRILYLSAEPLRARQASATHVGEIVRHLRRAGHEVTIVAARARGTYHGTPLARRLWSYAGLWLAAARRLGAVDIVYARAHPANLTIAALARLRAVPIVHEINGGSADIAVTHRWLRPLVGPLAALQRRQYRAASALVAVTPGLAAWAGREAPGVAIRIVANGVNGEIFHPGCAAIRPVDRPYALLFGSMTRWHGIELAIEAARSPSWPAGLDLVLVGEGQRDGMAKAAARTAPHIHHRPAVDQATLAGYIAGAALGLATMTSPAGRAALGLSPLKLYEMLACGLTVVVTDFPGQADLVRELDAGIVVPPDDAEAIARAVAQIHRDPPSRARRQEIGAAICRDHGWDRRAQQIDALLGEILAAAGRPGGSRP